MLLLNVHSVHVFFGQGYGKPPEDGSQGRGARGNVTRGATGASLQALKGAACKLIISQWPKRALPAVCVIDPRQHQQEGHDALCRLLEELA